MWRGINDSNKDTFFLQAVRITCAGCLVLTASSGICLEVFANAPVVSDMTAHSQGLSIIHIHTEHSFWEPRILRNNCLPFHPHFPLVQLFIYFSVHVNFRKIATISGSIKAKQAVPSCLISFFWCLCFLNSCTALCWRSIIFLLSAVFTSLFMLLLC